MLKNFARVLASVVLMCSAWAASADDSILINGAGATFPYPLYSKWFSEYAKLDTSVKINYQSIGSGSGIRQLLQKTVDFGASDAPMTNEELAKSDIPVLHIPTVLGAVVVSYHLPNVKATVKLTPDVISDIFLGKIKTWGDARIAALNPTLKGVESLPLLVVHRSDGSGTTAVFTDYLAKVSPAWKTQVGAGKAVNWPAGIGGKGNEGVAGVLKQTPGAIGYLELIYAEANGLQVASIQNAAGEFVTPNIASVTAAADAALPSMPEDFRISITNPVSSKAAYPISAFTYLLIYQTMPAEKGQKLVEFLRWAMGPGQAYAAPLSYSGLPASLITKVSATIDRIQVK